MMSDKFLREWFRGLFTREVRNKPDFSPITVSAAMDGHMLSGFERANAPLPLFLARLVLPGLRSRTAGYKARCRYCGKTIWVSDSGQVYNRLGAVCKHRK